jgi:hypothetical protein
MIVGAAVKTGGGMVENVATKVQPVQLLGAGLVGAIVVLGLDVLMPPLAIAVAAIGLGLSAGLHLSSRVSSRRFDAVVVGAFLAVAVYALLAIAKR